MSAPFMIPTRPLIPAQRVPVPPSTVVTGRISAGIDLSGVRSLPFRRPRTGTAWLLQGINVLCGQAGQTSGPDGTVDLVLKKSTRTVATIASWIQVGGVVTANNFNAVSNRQLVQPVPVYDTDDLYLEHVLGGGATGAFYIVQRAELQTVYL